MNQTPDPLPTEPPAPTPAPEGRLYVVGIGPGHPLDRTVRACQVLQHADLIVGYSKYIPLVQDLIGGTHVEASGAQDEAKRCRIALQQASAGKIVALLSAGDPGVYGTAGVLLDLAATLPVRPPIEIIPGITAATAAAARFGTPLMLDCAFLNLNDTLVSWVRIEKRLHAIGESDLVAVFYNPRSATRVRPFARACEILLQYRPPATPVGIGTAVGLPDETLRMTELAHLAEEAVGARSVVIVGESTSRVLDGWFVTPRTP